MNTNSTLDFSNWKKEDLETLQKERANINAIDKKLLKLLNSRAKSSFTIGSLKKKVSKNAKIFDAKREKELLEKLYALNIEQDGILSNLHVQSIWREILSSSRALQGTFSLAFLGPEGTFSYFAAKEFMGEASNFIACADFYEIFEKVENGTCSLGIVPLENSLYGTIGTCFDLFAKFDVSIEAEYYSRINLNLLSKEDSLLSIKKIYSHAQPVGQSSEWLRANMPHAEILTVDSSALAATLAQEEEGSAAIGHLKLSENFALNVLAVSIENDKRNWTRFALITQRNKEEKSLASKEVQKKLKSEKANKEQKNIKSSLLFTLQNKVGSLADILAAFAQANVNLQKLESRPMPSETWKYLFFADLECDIYAEEHKSLVKKLKQLSSSLTILGSYPADEEQKHTI